MNKKLHISLNKRWTGNLLGLLVILSMMLSTMAATPMTTTPPADTPTESATAVVSTATPVSPTATQPATATDTQAAPTASQTSPAVTDTAPAATETVPAATETSPVATNTVVAPTATSPAATETSPAVTETVPAATETTTPTVQPTPTTPAPTQPAQVQNPAAASRVNYHKIVVKFKTGAQPQVGAQSNNLPTSAAILKGLTVKPLFPGAGSSSSKSQVGAQSQTSAPVTNLASYSMVQLPADTSYNDAVQILKGLQSSDDVELAYMEPIYKPADITTQPYLDTQSNSNGVDAVDANAISGGKGDNVRVTDVEGGWQIDHEDLPITTSSLYAGSNSSDPNWVSHGTAVLGIIAGKGFVNPDISPNVIDGIAPHAELHMVSALSMDTATAIYDATQISRAGDIIVIPMEAQGPISGDSPQAGCDPTHFEDIPVEYWSANFAAIQAATSAGIIVVEAAGDGGMNLDDTITPTHPQHIYGGAFNRSNRDSGAIIVGAGGSGQSATTERAPLCFSNYGSRVDVQGWGENIATTGGDNDLNPGGTAKQTYTDEFGGTSGAAAMVAGAAADLQGIYKYLSSVPITPSQLRSLLVKTGAQQNGDAVHNHIGPLPNLGQASQQVSSPTLLGPADNSTVNTLKPTFDWSFYLNATSFELQIATGSSFSGNVVVDQTQSGTEFTPGINLSSGQQYYWHVYGLITTTTTTYDPVTQTNITTTTTTKTPPSDTFTFTVSAQADKASSPKLYKPDDKSTSSDFSPVLSWYDPSNTSNLSEYHIEISTSYTFADTDTNLGIDTTRFPIGYPAGETSTAGISDSSSFPITLNNEDDTYYWHVAACYGSGSGEYCSPWSGRRIIYTGLMAPDSLVENSLQELRPTFSWNEVDAANATAYYLQVAQVLSNSTYKVLTSATISLPKGQSVVPTTYALTHDLPKNLHNLDFRVAVKGKTVWSYSQYSGNLFNTGNPPPTVSLVAPKNKAIDSDYPFTPQFSWKPVKDNVKKDYVTDTYNIQISNTSDFEANNPANNISTTEVDGLGPGTGQNIPLTYTFGAALNPQTIYYWHVQSSDGSTLSDWSSTWILYTAVPYPNAPPDLTTPTVPTDGNNYVDSLRPTFSWDAVDLASSYQVEVATDSAFNNLKANVITKSGPPFVLPVTLPSLDTLYWRVRADGLYGWSDWTSGNSFNTGSAPPSLTSPSNGADLANFNPTLDWNSLPTYSSSSSNFDLNPITYDVEIGTSPNFDSVPPFVQDTSQGTHSNYPIVGNVLTDSDQYYWRVRAENSQTDGVSAWSQPYSFFTPAIVSGTVSDLTTGLPISGATVQIGGMSLSTTTDSSGKYQFFGLPGGNTYRLYASAYGSAPYGYIRQAYNVTTAYGQDATLNFNLATVPIPGTMKIVLTWENAPNDLEANLWLPKNSNGGTGYLVNEEAGHTGSLTTDPPEAKMDTPGSTRITAGFGPEAITVNEVPNGNKSTYPYNMFYANTYTYAVHINSPLGTFGQSNAVVTVYDGPIITYYKIFNVPTNTSGTWWKVFTIDGATRKITTINQVLNYNPQPYVAP